MSKYIFIPLFFLAVSVLFSSGLPSATRTEGTDKKVKGSPKITYSKATEAKAGEDVTLDCEVQNVDLSGLKDFKIQWRRVITDEEGNEDVIDISDNERVLLLPTKYDVDHPDDSYQYSLNVRDADEEDSGKYTCVVVFGASQKINADVPVTILKPAYFSDDTTKSVRVTEGDAISIDCQPGGSPKPDVYWERKGQELPYYGGQYFKANQFELPLVDRSHKGHYLCYADNGLADPVSSEVYIDVDYKPVVEVNEETIAGSIYGKAVLECVIDAIPEPRVEWVRDGERVAPSANYVIDTQGDEETGKITSRIDIQSLQVDDFGDYTCVGENSVGLTEKTVRVQLKVPPSIEKQTEGSKIFELAENIPKGRDQLPVALECIGSGVPSPEYRWTKNGEILLWETDPRMSLEYGTGTLLIRDPDIKDNGRYQCFAYNELGVAASDFIVFENETSIDFIREEPGDMAYEAEIGRPFRLSCPKAVGNPKPTLTWMKQRLIEEGVQMEYIDNERMVIDDLGTLWISHVTDEDDTEKNNFKYTCLATSELHPYDISLARTVSLVTVLPSDGRLNLKSELINIESFLMHSSPKEVTFRSNEENKLWCIFGGEPLPRMLWQRVDGTELSEDRFDTANHGQTLIFKDTQVEDAGQYVCVSSNGVGNSKKLTIDVSVEVAPRFKSDFKSQAQIVDEGVSVTFSCEILGEAVAKAEYEWYYNSRPIQFGPGSRRRVDGPNLIIGSTRTSDVGNYACKASNDVGYAYGQTTLSVIPNAPAIANGVSLRDGALFSDIRGEIETLSSDVQSLKDIVVEMQTSEVEEQQSIRSLLNMIAEKVLGASYSKPAESKE